MIKKIVFLFLLLLIILIISNFSLNENYNNLSDSIDNLTDNIMTLTNNMVSNVMDLNNSTNNVNNKYFENNPSYGEPKTRIGYPVYNQIMDHKINLNKHKKNIGGCKGTEYGCCDDGVTPKNNKDGDNCNNYSNCWYFEPGENICLPEKCNKKKLKKEEQYLSREDCENNIPTPPSPEPPSPGPPGPPPQYNNPVCFAQSLNNDKNNGLFCGIIDNNGYKIGLEGDSYPPIYSKQFKQCKDGIIKDNNSNLRCNQLCINPSKNNPDLCKKPNIFKNENSGCCEGWFFRSRKQDDSDIYECKNEDKKNIDKYVPNPYCPTSKLPNKNDLVDSNDGPYVKPDKVSFKYEKM